MRFKNINNLKDVWHAESILFVYEIAENYSLQEAKDLFDDIDLLLAILDASNDSTLLTIRKFANNPAETECTKIAYAYRNKAANIIQLLNMRFPNQLTKEEN
jgi:hypothetical protein